MGVGVAHVLKSLLVYNLLKVQAYKPGSDYLACIMYCKVWNFLVSQNSSYFKHNMYILFIITILEFVLHVLTNV